MEIMETNQGFHGRYKVIPCSEQPHLPCLLKNNKVAVSQFASSAKDNRLSGIALNSTLANMRHVG